MMHVPACTEHVLVLPLLLPAFQSCCTQAYALCMYDTCILRDKAKQQAQ